MENETLPQGTQSEEKSEDVQDGGENVSESLKLEEINELLGKEFKDIETAKKSLKDTQAYVGKKMEKVEPKEDPSVKETLENLQSQLNNSNFYRENPQYDTDETRALIKELGGDPAAVIEKDVFKNIFEKTSAYDKSQESKSVLHNSSRLAKASTKMDDAKTAMDTANDAASKGNMVEALNQKGKADYDAVQSVIDSFDKK